MAEEDIEREKIFSSDADPLEELAQLRMQEETSEDVEEEEGADVEEEETEAVDDEDLDTEEEPDSEEPSEDPKEEEETSSPKLYKFKADGQEFEFTQEEINEQFQGVFGKAMKFTQKMQKIAPYAKMISALEEENITQDQLNLAIDVLKGDKAALQKLIADKSIDIFDLDSDENSEPYQAKDYGKSEHEQLLAEIDREISSDPEYAQTIDIIGRQWDESSRQALADNPEWISGLHTDVKSGTFAKVAPEATKLKILDGGRRSDIEYYLLAGQQLQEKAKISSNSVDDPAKVAAQQYADDSARANKKRSASSTRSRAGTKSVVDYLDDNDEKFDSWYNEIMSKA